MASTDKLVKLDQLTTYDTLIKQLISTESGKAIKAVGFSSDGLKMLCYKTTDKTDTPVEVNIPAEFLKDWFFDITKSGVVENFIWSTAAYPGSSDPDLDGKPVVIFAVSKGTETSYSFASLDGLVDTYTGDDSDSAATTVTGGKIKTEVKISAAADNGISVKNDGLYVAPAADIQFATDEDINALFTPTA